MEINKKSAPQNSVVDIIRQGQWGGVVYLHKLSCGHLEPRKRPAKTEKIACSMCVKASTFTKMSAEFIRTGVGYEGYDEIEVEENQSEVLLSSLQEEVSRMRVHIAKKLQLLPDDIIIHIEESEDGSNISGGSIFLDRDSLFRLSEAG
jgi:hypothetical protein